MKTEFRNSVVSSYRDTRLINKLKLCKCQLAGNVEDWREIFKL